MLFVFQCWVAAGQSHLSAGGNFNQQLYGKCNNETLLTLQPRWRPSSVNDPIQEQHCVCVTKLLNFVPEWEAVFIKSCPIINFG